MKRSEQLLHQFKRELQLRNYADSSIKTYSSCLLIFFKAMNGKPSPLPIEEIKTFLLNIKNQNYDKQFRATIHHFYRLVLKTPISLDDIPYPRKTHYLPIVLSIQEVKRIIDATNNIKHRAILQLIYSCGLRISEPLKVIISKKECHILSDQKLLLVKGAKGYKDRMVPIPIQTIELLRNYCRIYNPVKWLFEGQHKEQYTARSVQQIFYRSLRKAGVYKKATPHSLRHSRATHLSDAGVDIYKIKDFLGHNNIKTTELYLHLAKQSLVNHIQNADAIIEAAFKNSNELKLELQS